MDEKQEYEIRNFLRQELENYFSTSNIVSATIETNSANNTKEISLLIEKISDFKIQLKEFEKEFDTIKETALKNKQSADSDRIVTNRNYTDNKEALKTLLSNDKSLFSKTRELKENFTELKSKLNDLEKDTKAIWFDVFGIGEKTRNLNQLSLSDKIVVVEESIMNLGTRIDDLRKYVNGIRSSVFKKLLELENKYDDVSHRLEQSYTIVQIKRTFYWMTDKMPKPMKKVFEDVTEYIFSRIVANLIITILVVLEIGGITSILPQIKHFIENILEKLK